MVSIFALLIEAEGLRCTTEVPNMGQSVDLVAVRRRCIIAVEAKLVDWKGAIRQCLAHRLVADFVLIALPDSQVTQLVIEGAQREGIGVLAFNQMGCTLTVVLEPKRSRHVWLPQRAVFKEQFERVMNAD